MEWATDILTIPAARSCVVATGPMILTPVCSPRPWAGGPLVSRSGVGFRCVLRPKNSGFREGHE